jgi:hypothetical protein
MEKFFDFERCEPIGQRPKFSIFLFFKSTKSQKSEKFIFSTFNEQKK